MSASERRGSGPHAVPAGTGSAAGPGAPGDPAGEAIRRFACFGGRCTVVVADAARPAAAAAAAADAEHALRQWHAQFSRFAAASEISRLNRDPRRTVAVSPLMARLAQAALQAARDTGGLVDATLGAEIVRAGYDRSLDGEGIPLDVALAQVPDRAPARPAGSDPLGRLSVDVAAGTITRSPGTVLDPGGVAKGLFADELGARLSGFDAYAVDCAGDIRLGGRAGVPRPIHVTSPFDAIRLHTFPIAGGAIATSGIGKRSWLDADARPAHHLLDPRTGRPAFTGVVQATALAATAARAEARAKAAVLSGPRDAARHLPDGGLLVYDDGSYALFAPAETPASGPAPAVPSGPAPAAPASGSAAAPPPLPTFASNRSASQARISVSTDSRSGSLRISWNRPL
ncbi:MAG TPA: FAD:protein FMN transferase [Solirubrobacteraceae bacterium]|nr:FAD:protein FMN transferase [Solirubrobacteraceae bacterium]